jgi:hypothetical protein
LLAQLISKNVVLVKAANKEGNNYQETFRRVHDSIESGFITATDALSNEWISSPVGELWLSELTKAGLNRTKIMTPKILLPLLCLSKLQALWQEIRDPSSDWIGEMVSRKKLVKVQRVTKNGRKMLCSKS